MEIDIEKNGGVRLLLHMEGMALCTSDGRPEVPVRNQRSRVSVFRTCRLL